MRPKVFEDGDGGSARKASACLRREVVLLCNPKAGGRWKALAAASAVALRLCLCRVRYAGRLNSGVMAAIGLQ